VTKSLENVRHEMKPTPYLVDGKEHDFSSKRTSKVKYIRYDLQHGKSIERNPRRIGVLNSFHSTVS
jgi:hypothetical protein